MDNNSNKKCVHEIRVLDLLPMHADRGHDTPIECRTRDASITKDGSSESYEALSYTWSDETEQVSIEVSGVEAKITPHLAAALRRLRLKDRVRTLWIDQLCINQRDKKEKARQVQAMRYIYTHCTRCLVWWGEIPYASSGIKIEDAQAGFEFLEYMASVAKTSTDPEQMDDDRHLPHWLQELPETLTWEDVAKEPRLRRGVLALQHILDTHNPWWTRVWTVQESLLPKTGLYIWGPLTLTWDTLRLATHLYYREEIPELLYCLSEDVDSNLVLSQLAAHQGLLDNAKSTTNAIDVIAAWRLRQTSEPRDNIYGLMGLISTSLPTVESCDYDLPLTRLFAGLTVDLIFSTQSLLPLMMDPQVESIVATPGLPGWAMDMSTQPLNHRHVSHMQSYCHYSADTGLGGQNWQQLKDDASVDSYRRLTLRGGLLLDTISSPIDLDDIPNRASLRAPSLMRAILGRMLKHNRATESTNSQYVKYSRDKSLYKEAFGRLALGDVVRDRGHNYAFQGPANASDAQSVLDYLESNAEPHEMTDQGNKEPIKHTYHETIYETYYHLDNQSFFSTSKYRFIGVGQNSMEDGDEIWLIPGSRVPVIFRRRRKRKDKDRVVERDFVGSCYVQGVMQGEALRDGYFFEEHAKTVLLY